MRFKFEKKLFIIEFICTSIKNVLYNTDDYQIKQLFTKRPGFDYYPDVIF
jgi:hypothetical protein